MSFVKKYSDDKYDYYHKETEVLSNDNTFSSYVDILHSKKELAVKQAKTNQDIKLNVESLKKIFKMSSSEPEEQVIFIFYNPEFFDSYPDMVNNKPGKEVHEESKMIPHPEPVKSNDVIIPVKEKLEKSLQKTVDDTMSSNHILANEATADTTINTSKTSSVDNGSKPKILKLFYIILVILGLVNLAYFVICLANSSLSLFHFYTIGMCVLLVITGLLGFISVNKHEKPNSLVVMLSLLCCLGSIGHIVIGIIDTETVHPFGGDIWFVYIVNGVSVLCEIIVLILAFTMKRKDGIELKGKELLLEMQKEKV